MTKSTGVGRHPPIRKIHGHSFVNGKASPEYSAWSAMKRRCLNPRAPNFPRYGGRGITVCGEWLASFENFLADMGIRPTSGHSLDRIDNNKGYSPDNCRWATIAQQCRNRSTNRVVVYNGTPTVVTDLPPVVGLSLATIKRRLRAGTPIKGVAS